MDDRTRFTTVILIIVIFIVLIAGFVYLNSSRGSSGDETGDQGTQIVGKPRIEASLPRGAIFQIGDTVVLQSVITNGTNVNLESIIYSANFDSQVLEPTAISILFNGSSTKNLNVSDVFNGNNIQTQNLFDADQNVSVLQPNNSVTITVEFEALDGLDDASIESIALANGTQISSSLSLQIQSQPVDTGRIAISTVTSNGSQTYQVGDQVSLLTTITNNSSQDLNLVKFSLELDPEALKLEAIEIGYEGMGNTPIEISDYTDLDMIEVTDLLSLDPQAERIEVGQGYNLNIKLTALDTAVTSIQTAVLSGGLDSESEITLNIEPKQVVVPEDNTSTGGGSTPPNLPETALFDAENRTLVLGLLLISVGFTVFSLNKFILLTTPTAEERRFKEISRLKRLRTKFESRFEGSHGVDIEVSKGAEVTNSHECDNLSKG